jgi:hypothetical protein
MNTVSIYIKADSIENEPYFIITHNDMDIFFNYIFDKIGKEYINKINIFNKPYLFKETDSNLLEIELKSDVSLDNANKIVESLKSNIDEIDDNLEFIKWLIKKMIAKIK